MTDAVILWKRLDTPGHDSARLLFHHGRWHLAGTAVFSHEGTPCRLDYAVTCDGQWRTRSAVVNGWMGSQRTGVSLKVDSAGRWSYNGRNVLECAGCVDVDLAFTPATNLLPIRRLELAPGAEAHVVAAWLRVPSFSLEPLDQCYRRVGATRYVYESGGGRFTAELSVNEHGFVTRYPPVWEEEVERRPRA